jgi:hypothetical protein
MNRRHFIALQIFTIQVYIVKYITYHGGILTSYMNAFVIRYTVDTNVVNLRKQNIFIKDEERVTFLYYTDLILV